MKRILLALLLSKVGFAQAQTYTPFPDSNAVWVNGNYGVDWSGEVPQYVLYSTTNYCMSNMDTIINTLTYSKLFICNGSYYGAIRDAGGEIYFVPEDETSEVLVYDFTVTAGQTITNVYAGNMNDYLVTAVDSILIGGTYRTVVDLNADGSWIEGIGCTRGLFNDPHGDMDGDQSLLCMSVGDTVFYPDYSLSNCVLDLGVSNAKDEPASIQIYPNPATDFVTLSWDSEFHVTSIQILDLSGREIQVSVKWNLQNATLDLSNLPSSIYLVRLQTEKSITQVRIIKQ